MLRCRCCRAAPAHPVSCTDGMWEWREYCRLPRGLHIAHGLWGLFCALYLLLFVFYLVMGGLRLARLPYARYRAGNVLHMWQTRVRKWCVTCRVHAELVGTICVRRNG